MRKFTFFLALMVTMVTTAFAQGSTPIDLASNADQMLYSNAYCTVTTWGDDFKSWDVLFDENPATFFHSDYSGNDSKDGLDHYIRVDMGEGNELSLFTFTFTTRNTNSEVNSPTAMIVEGSNEADGTYNTIKSIAGLPTTNATTWTSEVLGKEDVAYRYIRFRVTGTKTMQTQGGHVIFFISEFGMNRVAAGAVATKVEYTYTYNNETIGTETFDAFVGDAYPAPTKVPFGYVAETPEGEVEADAKKTIECVVSLPFEYAEKVADIKTWYRVQMHSNNKKYIQYIDGESYIEWADADVTEGEENSYLWAFVGTPATGFKLVNYAATVEKALCWTGNGTDLPAMGAYADGVNWKAVASAEAGEGYFCLQYPGSNNYMNAQNGKVASWNDNDAGSTFALTKAEPVLPAAEPLTATFEPDYYAYTYEEDGSVTAADGFGSFKLAFNERLAKPFESNNVKDLALEWVKDGEGNVVEVARVVADMVGGLEIELASRVEAPGVYTLTIPADAVENYDGSKTYEGGSFVITIPAAETPAIPEYQLYVLANGSPAPFESPVTSVQNLAFTFGDAAITLGENPTVGIFDPIKSTYVAEGKLDVNTEMFPQPILAVQFSEPFKTAGAYMLHIPANTFMVGEVIYPEIIVEFTIQGSVTPEIPEAPALTIESVTPTEGEVDGISEIIITFSEMIDETSCSEIYLTDAKLNQYELKYQFDESLSTKQMKFVAETPITTPGKYSLDGTSVWVMDLNGNVIKGFDKTYTWTVKEAAVAPEEPKGDIDVTKEYYLEVEYMAGMSSAKGYITIDGMQNQVYIDSEKKQAFKFELVENGTDIFYTLSTEVEGATGSSKLYLNCDAAAVMGNATNASQLFFEKESATSDKYYVKSGNAYLRAGNNAERVGTNQAYIVYNEECDPYFRIKFTLVADGEEPEVPGVTAEPLVLVSEPVTVEKISKIELEFDREVASVDANAKFKLLKRDQSLASMFAGSDAQVSGNKVTFDFVSPISESGTFTFVIPADAIVAADGGKVAETSYKITVVAAPKPSKTSIEVENSLSTFTINFSEEIEFVAGHTVEKLEVKAGNEVVAEIPVANIAINAKNLTLTLDKAIAPEGTTQYTVAIPANFITKKGSTTLQYAGGNITVKVKLPFVLKSINPESDSTVEVFEKIVAEYNGTINFVPDALSFKLVNIADNSEIALTATKDGNVVTFTTDAEVPNGTYKLANLNYVVDNSTYLAPAELPEYTITVNDAEDTAIDGVEAEAENDVIYDLTGRRVNEIVKGGIYIINGKKVLVK